MLPVTGEKETAPEARQPCMSAIYGHDADHNGLRSRNPTTVIGDGSFNVVIRGAQTYLRVPFCHDANLDGGVQLSRSWCR